LECELIDRRVWKTQTEARLAVFTWIEAWYNPHRRHSSLAQMLSINFERMKSNEKLNANKEQKSKQTFKMSI
jgi:putative transposase